MIVGQARNSGPGAARRPRSIDEPSYTIRAQGSGSHPSGVEWVDWSMASTNVRDGVYQSRAVDEPAHTITAVARSFRWHTGILRVETPGKKGGNMQLRNNNTANAATRQMHEPAPTLYFGQRSNYCAWEQGCPPDLTIEHQQTEEVPMTQTALDLFAGAGGWSLACRRLGIDEVGVENMPAALATRAAAGFKSYDVTDVWDIDYAGLRGRFDGLIASPPCQTFSAAGKGAGRKALDDVLSLISTGAHEDVLDLKAAATHFGDDRTALVLVPLHAAWAMRPEWIAWEQVPTVLPVWEACADELRSWGYSVWTGNLQAEMYGVPQTRKRAILIAHRDREVAPPAPTHSRYYPRDKARLDDGVLPWVSMAQALGWGEFTMVSNYGTGGDPANRGTREGADPAPAVTSKVDRNKIEWQLASAGATARYTAGQVPRDTVVPAATMTGKGTAYWTPAEQDERHSAATSRRVTVAEAGVLQSFPADHPWQGHKGQQYLQCGNAVPPLLAQAVLTAVV